MLSLGKFVILMSLRICTYMVKSSMEYQDANKYVVIFDYLALNLEF